MEAIGQDMIHHTYSEKTGFSANFSNSSLLKKSCSYMQSDFFFTWWWMSCFFFFVLFQYIGIQDTYSLIEIRQKKTKKKSDNGGWLHIIVYRELNKENINLYLFRMNWWCLYSVCRTSHWRWDCSFPFHWNKLIIS